ncbi:hypothetical protein BpHYR1_026847 [Brachionus plicatilis]|uniref:Uncharacterized protein n=1 Tax=Brachionus plicatilis TaxID=10195 RepID=A0A3M7S6W0_BRAPC|nr:hypothetical protein BpHYR1_026847 [Brachionus plicatilis]
MIENFSIYGFFCPFNLHFQVTGVLNSITWYDIEPIANSLDMVLYNLWIHIAPASGNFVFELLKMFGLPITLINLSLQISPKFFDLSSFWYICWIHFFAKFKLYSFKKTCWKKNFYSTGMPKNEINISIDIFKKFTFTQQKKKNYFKKIKKHLRKSAINFLKSN